MGVGVLMSVLMRASPNVLMRASGVGVLMRASGALLPHALVDRIVMVDESIGEPVATKTPVEP